jgi:hypothetical protein
MADITTTATQSKPKTGGTSPAEAARHKIRQPRPKGKAAAKPKPAPRELTGSAAVLEAFLEEDVQTIFGYPGGAIMPIYDALYDYKDRLNHILVRHEQGGIHAAQGFARTSGKTGVVFATSGPGATNLVTGLADAMIDSTPSSASPARSSPTSSAPTPFRKRT